jgi:F0F1-type ATP synthase assembly protein I
MARKEQSSRPVDEDLLGGLVVGVFVGSFDEFAVACPYVELVF